MTRWLGRAAALLAAVACGAAAGFWSYQRIGGPPEDDSRIREIVELTFDSGREQEAIARLRRRLAEDPDDNSDRRLLAQLLARADDLRGCVAVLEEVPDASLFKPEALLRQAQASARLGRAADAVAAYRALIGHPDASPEFVEQALREAAVIHQVRDETGELRAITWELHDRLPEERRLAVLQNFGNLELTRVYPEERIGRLRGYLDADEADWRSRVALGAALIENSDFPAGLAELRRALAEQPDEPQVWRQWLRGLYQVGELDTLAGEMEKVPEPLQREADYWRLRAIVAEERGDWPGAADAWLRAIERNPAELQYRRRVTVALRRVGRADEVAEHVAAAERVEKATDDLRKVHADWQAMVQGKTDAPRALALAGRMVVAYRAIGRDDVAKGWEAMRHGLAAQGGLDLPVLPASAGRPEDED